MLPVHVMHITYDRPARYYDLITVRTIIRDLATVRMVFTYELRNEAGDLLCDATTTLVFVDRTTMRPRRAPEGLVKALADHFKT